MPPSAPSEVLPEAWTEWSRTFRYPPEVLFHYTTGEALLSIISTKRMWAANLEYTNDPTDLRHGERIVSEALDRAIDKCIDDPFMCVWLDGFKRTTRLQLEQNDFYSISFCTDGDLLSQWRGYGAVGGGFAMGWKAISEYPEMPMRVGVTYDEQLQMDVADKIVGAHLAYLEGVKKPLSAADLDRLARATGSLGVFFSLFLHGFKHPTFAAEDEFRRVYIAFNHVLPEGQAPRFRKVGSIIKPYIEADFSRAKLVEIIYGPTADPMTPKWLRVALDANGFSSTKVTASRVPMRSS